MRMNLQKKQIERAPSIESARPISRRYEQVYYLHFQPASYWQPDTPMWGSPILYPHVPILNRDEFLFLTSSTQSSLGRSSEVTGYRFHTKDGNIGRLKDLIVDDEAWTVRYVEGDTRK